MTELRLRVEHDLRLRAERTYAPEWTRAELRQELIDAEHEGLRLVSDDLAVTPPEEVREPDLLSRLVNRVVA